MRKAEDHCHLYLNLEILEVILKKIQEKGFLISPTKAQMLQQEVTYLGMELGIQVCCPDAGRIELISKLPGPPDITALHSFLRLTEFSCDFIEGYSKLAQPLF